MPCKQRRISASSTAHAASRDRSTSLHRLNSSRPGGFIKGEDASEDVKPLIGSNRRFLKPGTGPYCRSEKIQISPRVLGILKPFNFCILSVFAAVPFQRRFFYRCQPQPPPVTTTRPEMIAADGARSFSGMVPTTLHALTAGSNCSKSPTKFRAGCELLHRPP